MTETTGGRRSAADLEDELVAKVLRLEPDKRTIVLSTHDLTKRFAKTLAVDRLNLTVHRGDVFGFPRPQRRRQDDHDPHDRAASSTRPAGTPRWPTTGCPRDKREALRHIGGFVEVPAFYGNMSARRNLRLMG